MGVSKKHKTYRRTDTKGVTERKCTTCLEWMVEDTNNFYLMNKQFPERGYTSRCKSCNAKNNSEHQKSNKERYYQYKTGWYKSNPKKAKEQRADWHQEHKEKRIDDHRRFAKTNPEKIREYNQSHRNHDITKREWENCLRYFNHQCAYCGITEEESLKRYKQRLHKDHYDCEGANDLSNAIPSCKSCNSLKHKDDGKTWFMEQEFFKQDNLNCIDLWITKSCKDYMEVKPPYIITRKQNEDKRTYHWELWSVDDKRNMVELVDIGDKKKDLDLSLIH